jgi:hypothetical protein
VLWTNNNASAYAVVVDSNDNVLITGPAGTSKYSGAGIALWSNSYVYGLAKAIAVDRNSSNVYVTGYSLTGTNYFFATIAYSGAGVPLWTNNFNRPGAPDDRAIAIAVNNSGNVFVTGRSSRVYNSSLESDFKYATVAYSSVGMPLWTNVYSNGGDVPAAIATDTIGNVFVTGSSSGPSGGGYATVSYSNAGVPLWTNRYDPHPGPGDATAMAVDRSGNVFVAGEARIVPPYGVYHFVTVKYNTTVAPNLNIENVDSQVVLTWTTPSWSLQYAPTAASTFTNISAATSPYTNNFAGSEGYFRLQSP